MPNTEQIGDILFKKIHGLGTTQSGRHIFNEPIIGRPFVSLNQIWGQSDLIPNSAPISSSGVIQKITNHQLSLVVGTDNSFTGELLRDVIPFNWGDGSYNYSILDSISNPIPFGQNDWTLDTEAGILMFNSGVPENMPPSISFYRYTGIKGVTGNGGETSSNADTLDGYHASNFVSGSETGVFYTRDNPSGFITGVNLTNYVTRSETGNLSNADTLDGHHSIDFYSASNPENYISAVGDNEENYFAKWTPEGLSTGVIYQDNERVGVGSFSPETNLHVEGGITSFGYTKGINTNVALNKQTYQIDDFNINTQSSKGVDGNNNTYSKTNYYSGAWWEIDLGAIYLINRVVHKRPVYYNNSGEPLLDENGYFLLDESGYHLLSEVGGTILEASGAYVLQSAEGFGIDNEAINPVTIGYSTGKYFNSYSFTNSGLSARYLRLYTTGNAEVREFEVYSYIGSSNKTIETSNFYGPVNLAIESGRVGIKTTAPQVDFDVDGVIGASGIQGPSGYTGNYIDLVNRILTGGDWVVQGVAGGTSSNADTLDGYHASNFISGAQTGEFYSSSNPSGFITLSQVTSTSIEGLSGAIDLSGLGNIVISTGNGIIYISGDSQSSTNADTLDGYHASNFVSGAETGVFYPASNPSGFITSAQAGGVTSLENLSGVIDVSGLGNITISTGNGILFISGASQSFTDADTLDGYHASNFVSGAQTGIFITTGQTGAFSNAHTLDGYHASNFVSGSQTGNFVTTGDSRTLGFLGSLGVGTSAPRTPIEIKSTSDTVAASILFARGDSYVWKIGVDNLTTPQLGTAASNFVLYDASLSSARMMCTYTNGYIGINSTSPAGRLHVIQAYSTVPNILLADSDTNATRKISRIAAKHYTNAEEDFGIILTDSDGTNNIIKYGGGTSYSNCATKHSFCTAANATTTVGTERVTITKDGYVGINHTNPAHQLAISGLAISFMDPTIAYNGAFYVIGTEAGAIGRGVLGLNSGAPFLGFGPGNTDRDIYVQRNAGSLTFGFSISNTEKFRMTTGGYFGINTTAPTNPLSVSGTSRMDGNVTINGTVGGANNLVLTGMTGALSNADTLDTYHSSYFVNTGQTGQFYPRNGNPEGYLTSGTLPAGTTYGVINLPSGDLDGTYTEGLNTVQKANVYIDWTSGESFHYIFKSSGINWTVESCPKIYFIHKNVVTGKKITVAITNTGVIFDAPNGAGTPIWTGEAPFNNGLAWDNSYSQSYPYQPGFSSSMISSSSATESISDIFSFVCFGKGIYGKVEMSAAAVPGSLLL